MVINFLVSAVVSTSRNGVCGASVGGVASGVHSISPACIGNTTRAASMIARIPSTSTEQGGCGISFVRRETIVHTKVVRLLLGQLLLIMLMLEE